MRSIGGHPSPYAGRSPARGGCSLAYSPWQLSSRILNVRDKESLIHKLIVYCVNYLTAPWEWILLMRIRAFLQESPMFAVKRATRHFDALAAEAFSADDLGFTEGLVLAATFFEAPRPIRPS